MVHPARAPFMPTQSDDVDIHALRTGDADLLQQFAALVCGESRYGLCSNQISPRFNAERWLQEQSAIVLTAVTDGEVVGGIAAYSVHLLGQGAGDLHIQHLVVLPKFRRRGIATRLINGLRQRAERQGVSRMLFAVDLRQGDAIACLRSVGRRRDAIQFELALA